MEFQFRAGDERSRPPPPSTYAAATSSQSAGPVPPPASDPEELWRQAVMARIRERILREEAEKLAEIEAQVRRELMEERFQLMRSGLERSLEGAGSLTTAPTRIELQARSKANESVAFPVKRKITDVVVASAASSSTSTNTMKLDLSCTLCGIPATSEKALQDHLKGKVHMRKAAKLAQPTAEVAHEDDDEVHSKANALAFLLDKQKNPNIFTVTSQMQKPDLTCKVCGNTSTSQKAMQDHLEGKAHKRKVSMLPQPTPEEEAITNMVPSKENVPKDASILSTAACDKKQKLDLTCTLCGIPVTSEKAMEDHLKGMSHRKKAAALVREEAEHGLEEKEEEGGFTPTKKTMMTNDGTIHDVMQMDGHVFCEVCNVSTADVITMMCHLQGTRHISKARQEARKLLVATATIAAAVVDGDAQMVAMMINGVSHNVRRVGSELLCELCDVKVPLASEGVMRSHLSGKIHTKKLKAMATAVDMGAVGKAEVITKDVAFGSKVHISETRSQEVMKDHGAGTICGSEMVDCMEERAVGACVPESMAPDERATFVEKRADTDENSSRTDGTAMVRADKEVMYQVEGKVFIVLRQPDGKLSCRLCGVHGCEKYDMIKHLYTHLGNVHLADEISR